MIRAFLFLTQIGCIIHFVRLFAHRRHHPFPCHQVEGHRPHRQQTPVPIPHVSYVSRLLSEVKSIDKIQIFQYLKPKSFNRPYLGY
jgi:hypothetical protein